MVMMALQRQRLIEDDLKFASLSRLPYLADIDAVRQLVAQAAWRLLALAAPRWRQSLPTTLAACP